jgi:ATP-dependent DNA ligase
LERQLDWHHGLSFAPNCEKLVHGLLVTRERQPRFRDGIAPCIPTRAYKVPSRTGWVHERLQERRVGDQVRLFTRRRYDWSGRYPAIAVTATLLRAKSFTLDGEAVVCGPDGVAIFDALHRRGTITEAKLYAQRPCCTPSTSSSRR